MTTTPHDKALEAFTEYFVRNYPGPDTVIFNPKWHAPKLFNAAMHAIRDAGGVVCQREPSAWAAMADNGNIRLWSRSHAELPALTGLDIIPLHAPLTEAGNGDGWLPIEMAPKDGNAIWLGHECGLMAPAYFKIAGKGFWVNHYTGLPIHWTPRFWRAFPSPPTASSNETGRAE